MFTVMHSLLVISMLFWLKAGKNCHISVLSGNSTMETNSRVPTSTGKSGKMRENFPAREKSENFEILPESQGKLDQKIIKLFYGASLKTLVSRHFC